MRALVTGVSGFAGGQVASFLARSGCEVVGLQRRNTLFSERAAAAGARLVNGDLAEPIILEGRFDAVVHAAATSPAPRVTVARMVHDNVDATAALLDLAEEWGTRAFIYFSSLSVYGEIDRSCVDENCPIRDPDAYGATKYIAELMVSERAERLPSLALRLPGVIGPGAHRNWLSRVATKLRAGATIEAFQLESSFNNAAYVDDISRLVMRALREGWTGFDTAVLGARGGLSVKEVIERMAKGLGVRAQIKAVAPRKSHFTLSSDHAIARWRYDPMEIGEMLDRYAADLLADTRSIG